MREVIPASSPTPASTHPGGAAPLAAAEVQGLYGPFTFPEKLLQKIWANGDFDRRNARTTDGRALEVLQPGRWNSLGGPDFRNARLRFEGGPEFTADVELHLHASDWVAHAHASDPAYGAVRLHVVLFPPAPDHVTRGADGNAIPVLVLLPLLLHDLEEYAADDAVERLSDRPAAMITETLGVLPAAELENVIRQHASERWRQKVHFARLRIARLGWEAACHHTALEILGYRFNRAPMLRLAGARPLAEWSSPVLSSDELFEAERATWSLQGIRPANHPRLRLAQYATWARARPDWPARLEALAKNQPVVTDAASTAEVRRTFGFTSLRRTWAEALCANAVGGTRFDNLMCDGFLPLIAARSAAPARPIWYHWFTGDLPPLWPRVLRQLGVFNGRSRPACHGAAQGLLGWLLARERAEAR